MFIPERVSFEALPPPAPKQDKSKLQVTSNKALLAMVLLPIAHRGALGAGALSHAALIPSFLGALWSGLAASATKSAPTWVWPAGVLPSLLTLAVRLARSFSLADLPDCNFTLALAVAATCDW
jgi:hypothetical protein